MPLPTTAFSDGLSLLEPVLLWLLQAQARHEQRLADARQRYQQRLADVRTAHELECQRARAEHAAEVERVRQHNEQLRDQVRYAVCCCLIQLLGGLECTQVAAQACLAAVLPSHTAHPHAHLLQGC